LKIEQEILEDHRVKLNVEIEGEPWESAKHQAARRLAKRVKIPGFRPGKASYPVIVRSVGEGAIIEQALDILLDDIYPKILEEAKINPYGPGKVEELKEYDPPKFEIIVPLQPEIQLSDYKALEVPYKPPEVGDEEVEEILENLRQRNARNEPVQRPAEPGDIIYMRVSGKRLDVEDETEAVIYDRQFSSARLGQENSATDRQFFEGFSNQLIGLSPQDRKTFTHTFPDDYDDEDLQGTKVEFEVIVTNVQAYSLPELNDEFAQTISDFDTLNDLRQDIRSRLQDQANQDYDDEYEGEVIEKLIADCVISYPREVVEYEKDDILANLDYRLSQQNLDQDTYLQVRGLSKEELDEEIAQTAEDNVRRKLLLYKVADVEKIVPDAEKLSRTTEEAIEVITSDMTPKQVKDWEKGGKLANLLTNITADLTLRKTVEYLVAIAKGEPLPEAEAQVENETPIEETEPESEGDESEAA